MTDEYKRQQKQWEKRRADMVRLYRGGKNMQEIGDKFGVTRQRVRAVLQAEGALRVRSSASA